MISIGEGGAGAACGCVSGMGESLLLQATLGNALSGQ